MSKVRGHHLSMVVQEPMTAPNPTMRIGNQVAEVMLIHRTQPGKKAAQAATVELLDQVGLPRPAQPRLPPGEFSRASVSGSRSHERWRRTR